MVKSINGHKSNPPHHPGPPKPVHQLLISESSPFGFKRAAQPPLGSSRDLCKPLELHASGGEQQSPHHYQQQDDNKEGDNGRGLYTPPPNPSGLRSDTQTVLRQSSDSPRTLLGLFWLRVLPNWTASPS